MCRDLGVWITCHLAEPGVKVQKSVPSDVPSGKRQFFPELRKQNQRGDGSTAKFQFPVPEECPNPRGDTRCSRILEAQPGRDQAALPFRAGWFYLRLRHRDNWKPAEIL